MSLPERLELQVALFDRDPQLVVAGSAYDCVDESGAYLVTKHRPESDTRIRWHSLFAPPFHHSTVMARGSVLRRPDMRYGETYRAAVDVELWPRLLECGGATNLSQPLVHYRVHASQVSAQQAKRQERERISVSRRSLRSIGIDLGDDDVTRLGRLYAEAAATARRRRASPCAQAARRGAGASGNSRGRSRRVPSHRSRSGRQAACRIAGLQLPCA